MPAMLTQAALPADPDRFHLIDVRDVADYATAHVTGAVSISLAALGSRVDGIPAEKTPVTICGKGGGRSAEGATSFGRLATLTPSGSKPGRTAGAHNTRITAETPATKGDTHMRDIDLDIKASTPVATEVAAILRHALRTGHGNPSSCHWAGVPDRQMVGNARTRVATSSAARRRRSSSTAAAARLVATR